MLELKTKETKKDISKDKTEKTSQKFKSQK